MQIKYSEIARKSFQENLNFLEKMWTQKEINLFLDDVQWVLSELARETYNNTKNPNSTPEVPLLAKNM